VTADGAEHEVDTIISAIGYRYNRSLLVDRVVGMEDRTLGEVWDRSPRAYLGTTVPGFPNFFILLGPNSIGINSVIFSLEAQIAYVMDALRTMERKNVDRIELSPGALNDFVAECNRRSDGSVWTDGGCKAYYVDDTGRNFGIYPGFASEYRWRTRRFDPAPYELTTAEHELVAA
jgi:cation diffusion facilitator CzcD-associated flavoprotein CzcO